MLIEICANSLTSARAALQGGAHRIELCEQLEIGGVTPSSALILQSVQALGSMPVFVLVRPRGGDFCYTEEEIQQMEKDILFCKANGVAGVVIGVLTEGKQVDVAVMRRLIDLARPMDITFHRAFDRAIDPFAALETIIELGVERILTSGQENTAWEGLAVLTKLVERARGRIIILPGSGINKTNIVEIVGSSGATEAHLSAKKTMPDGSWQTDLAEVKNVITRLSANDHI